MSDVEHLVGQTMSWVRKLRGRDWHDRFALLRATALVVGVRAVFVLLPFRTALRILGRLGGSGVPHTLSPNLLRMVWAVGAVSRRLFPRNPCLTQAAAVQMLFRWSGRPADLRIGVRRDEAGELKAHSWVESAGEVVIGGRDSTSVYTSLPGLQPPEIEPWGSATRRLDRL